MQIWFLSIHFVPHLWRAIWLFTFAHLSFWFRTATPTGQQHQEKNLCTNKTGHLVMCLLTETGIAEPNLSWNQTTSSRMRASGNLQFCYNAYFFKSGNYQMGSWARTARILHLLGACALKTYFHINMHVYLGVNRLLADILSCVKYDSKGIKKACTLFKITSLRACWHGFGEIKNITQVCITVTIYDIQYLFILETLSSQN